MKKQSLHMATHVRNKFFTVSIAAFLLAGGTSLNAQSVELPKTAVIKHLGNSEETMFFQVRVDNIVGERFSVSIKDHEGTTIFQEFYTDKNFDKKFRVPKTDNNRVTFHIKGSKDTIPQSFEINTNTKVVEEVIVKRIN